jgi:hypothetical protein
LLLNKIGIYPIIDIEYLRGVNVEIDSAVEILKKFPIKFLQIRWKKPLSDREFLEIAMGIRKRWRRNSYNKRQNRYCIVCLCRWSPLRGR